MLKFALYVSKTRRDKKVWITPTKVIAEVTPWDKLGDVLIGPYTRTEEKVIRI
jgi:hypothetical protein